MENKFYNRLLCSMSLCYVFPRKDQHQTFVQSDDRIPELSNNYLIQFTQKNCSICLFALFMDSHLDHIIWVSSNVHLWILAIIHHSFLCSYNIYSLFIIVLFLFSFNLFYSSRFFYYFSLTQYKWHILRSTGSAFEYLIIPLWTKTLKENIMM